MNLTLDSSKFSRETLFDQSSYLMKQPKKKVFDEISSVYGIFAEGDVEVPIGFPEYDY